MELANFIRANKAAIASAWVDFAATLRPFDEYTDIETLKDSIGGILANMAAGMEASETPAQQAQKSWGRCDATAAEPSLAWEHGTHRLRSGVEINDVVAEYRALRAVVVRMCKSAPEQCALSADELIKFDEAIDQAAAESLASYTRELDKLRNTLLAVLAHDLRSPLHAISMTGEALAGLTPPTSRTASMIERIRRGAMRMSRLIDDFLAFLRPTLGGAMPIERHAMDMAETCREIVAEVSSTLVPGRVVLKCGGNTHGEWDAARVEQILTNLLRNAVEHGDPKLPITVTVVGQVDDVRVEVHNFGEPIPPSAMQSIFKPLVQLSTSTDRRREHLGLGLFIAKELVERHNGRMSVRSSAEEGTTFFFALPRH